MAYLAVMPFKARHIASGRQLTNVEDKSELQPHSLGPVPLFMALGHVGNVEHVQDAANEQNRIADEPQDCDRAPDQP